MVKIKQFLMVVDMVVKLKQFLVVIDTVVKIKKILVVINTVIKIKQFLVVIDTVVKINSTSVTFIRKPQAEMLLKSNFGILLLGFAKYIYYLMIVLTTINYCPLSCTI